MIEKSCFTCEYSENGAPNIGDARCMEECVRLSGYKNKWDKRPEDLKADQSKAARILRELEEEGLEDNTATSGVYDAVKCQTKDDGKLRSFDTGATRDTAEGKLDFEGFLSPTVLRQFAKYMNMNRLQSDGNIRDSDNWQKGIPMAAYMKSAYRHFFEWWEGHRQDFVNDSRSHQIEVIGAMCGLMFNVMGYLHEWLKEYAEIDFDGSEPTKEMEERQNEIKEKEQASPRRQDNVAERNVSHSLPEEKAFVFRGLPHGC